MSISVGVVDLITVKGKVLKDADSRSIIEESFKAFQDGCSKRRLLNIAIEVRVGVEYECTTEIEEKGVIVKLVVGKFDFFHPNEEKAKYDLNIRKKEDDEDKPLKI